MALTFEIRKERIVLKPEFFLFKEFTDIYDWDRSPAKVRAHKMLRFIYLLCDITEDCQLKDIATAKREAEALFYAYGSREYSFTPKEIELVTAGINCYKKYSENAEERLLAEFDAKASTLRGALEKVIPETVPNVINGVTSFASNSDIITKALKELDSVKRMKGVVISAIKKDAMTQRVRGQIVLSPHSKGLIEVPVMDDRRLLEDED